VSLVEWKKSATTFAQLATDKRTFEGLQPGKDERHIL